MIATRTRLLAPWTDAPAIRGAQCDAGRGGEEHTSRAVHTLSLGLPGADLTSGARMRVRAGVACTILRAEHYLGDEERQGPAHPADRADHLGRVAIRATLSGSSNSRKNHEPERDDELRIIDSRAA